MINENDLMNEIVTIIIPTYSGTNTLERCLKSVSLQSYTNIEVIVVDDNGKGTINQDRTAEIVLGFKDRLNIKYLVHDVNKNGAAARNTGLLEASGSYICFLDDDDIYFPNRIMNAVNSLKKQTEKKILFCDVLIQRNNRLVNIVKPEYVKDVKKELLFNTGYIGTGSNIFFRRNFLEDVKAFDERYFRRQDNEFLLRHLTDENYTIINSLDIVKCNSGNGNLPTYKKLKASNELYYADFRYLIDSLVNKDKDFFYQKEYARLFFCSLFGSSVDEKREAKKQLINLRDLTVVENFQYILSYIGFGQHNVLCALQPMLSKIKNYNKHKKILKALDSKVLLYIREYGLIE